MTNSKIKERIFIVGCPRSGTTLLQRLISNHYDVASFPETNLFLCLTSPNSRRGSLGIASQGARKAFLTFIAEVNHPEMERFLSPFIFSVRQYATVFIKTLDTIALLRDKSCWIEKTPYHLRRVDVIEKFVNRAKFIHIVRNGEDVIASLYDVTHKYPETWGGAKDIDRCLNEWLNDVKLSLFYASRSNHLIVKYEHLLSDSKTTIKRICEFIGIDYSDYLLETQTSSDNKIIKSKEVWKSNVLSPITDTRNNKFLSLFKLKEQNYILKKISTINLDLEML